MKERDFWWHSLRLKATKIDLEGTPPLAHPELMDLLEYLHKNPVNRTYFGIGSCPHTWGEQLSQKEDQLLPLFFREWMEMGHGTSFRVIHYDPAFEYHIEDLIGYFESLGFEKAEDPVIPCFQCWSCPDLNLEVFLFTNYFSHETDAPTLQTIVENIMNEERIYANLVVQEYTGHSLEKLALRFYKESFDSYKFLNRILFDVSYGIDSGCMTDMSQFRPFTDAEGNFYNLLLLEPYQLFKLIGKNEKMDCRIRSMTVHEYKKILNTYHVDYRRALRGEPALFECTGTSTQPDEIMSALASRLHILIQTLHRLQHISTEDRARFDTLLKEYKGVDVYKWYDAMSKLVPLVS